MLIRHSLAFIYIIINVLSGRFQDRVDGFGRAIARWNRIAIKMIMSLTFFGSRAPRARSTRKCGFYYIRQLETVVLRLILLI